MLYHLTISGNFQGSETWHGHGIFGGLIFAPIRPSPSVEIRSTRGHYIHGKDGIRKNHKKRKRE